MSRIDRNRSKKTRYMVIASLFAALICLTTAYILHIPLGGKGYVHIGDAFIYLGAALLPMPYAIICAAIGAAFADLITGYAIYIIPTLIIKSILVLFITSKSDKIINVRNLIGTFIAGFAGWILYMIVDGIIYGSFAGVFVFSAVGAIQPIGSFIVFVLVGLALDKLDIKKKYFR